MTLIDAPLVVCDECPAELTPTEQGPTGPEGTLCQACYWALWDATHFPCCFCGEDETEDAQETAYVLFDPSVAAAGRSQGVYRVVAWPYFAQPVVGIGRLYPEAAELVAPLMLPYGCPDDYPVGHLCWDCQARCGIDEIA